MATTFSLKQGETRTSHGPIPHPLSDPILWQTQAQNLLSRVVNIVTYTYRFFLGGVSMWTNLFHADVKCRWQATNKTNKQTNSTFLSQKFRKFKFSLPYLESAWKWIQMSTNKPSIGSGVHEIASVFVCLFVCLVFKGAQDNFSLIPQFFSKKLRFLYH